ncbi:MAG: hypothetical protein K8U57_21440 [Planctomycetes bacterium]|nr:hypothetical protein [Planctomycetota bacterium]
MITWKDSTGRYVSSESARLGKIRVGSVFFDGTTRGAARYRASVRLPQAPEPEGNFETEELAKAWVEKCVRGWIAAAGLQIANTSEVEA